jgi:hypothetical protein
MNCSPKHPSAAFWLAAALVAVLVAYPLSFGPAIWFGGQSLSPWVSAAYWPMGRLAVCGPRFIRKPLARYASAFEFGTTAGMKFGYDLNHDGPYGIFVPVGDGRWQSVE